MSNSMRRVTYLDPRTFAVDVEPIDAHCYTDLEDEIERELGLAIDIDTETKTADGWLRYVATRTPRDWPAFWSALTPAQVAEALRAAPFVAEPWVLYHDGWHRESLRCGDGLPIAEAYDNGWWQVYGDDHANGNVKGADAAKAAADAHLTRLGWALL